MRAIACSPRQKASQLRAVWSRAARVPIPLPSQSIGVGYTDVTVKVVPELTKMIGVAKCHKVDTKGVRVMNREVGTELIETMKRIENGEKSPPQDEDWVCPKCDYVNYASKTKRMFCGKCWTVRSPLPARRSYLLTGQRGIGKSMELVRTVQYARDRGWVAIVVPSAWHFVNAGHWVSPSETSTGRFEQPHGALDVMKWAFEANRESSLAKVKVKDEEIRDRWGADNLKDLLAKGLEEDTLDEERTRDDASSVLADVIRVLYEADEVPTLLAVDEINCWFPPTVEHFFKQKQLGPRQIASVDEMMAPLTDFKDIKRGLAIYADTTCRPVKLPKKFRQLLSHMPLELQVKPLNDDELKAAVLWMKEFFFIDKNLDEQYVNNLAVKTQRNHRLLYEHLLLANFDLYDDEEELEYRPDDSLFVSSASKR